MNAKQLKQAGEAIYGKRWKAPLARDLGLDPATLWRYLQKDDVPRTVELAIQSLLTRKK